MLTYLFALGLQGTLTFVAAVLAAAALVYLYSGARRRSVWGRCRFLYAES